MTEEGTGAVYMATSGRQLAQAQTELLEHLHSTAGGLCVACGERPPCAKRGTLTNLILSYGSLPRRRPGYTLPGGRQIA
jgi:hypothetical protein